MTGLWTRALAASAALLCAPELDAGSLDWRQSTAGNFDYGRQLIIPAGFGTGEFTLEVWIRPNDGFPVGSTAGGGQLTNWSSEDFSPYSSTGWWFNGNFLLDGHNNAGSNFQNGTFSLQLYGGGRVRWLFGDGASGGLSGNLWAVQASQTGSADSLLDGDWHHVALVRRFSGVSQSTLELWVDGALIDTETSTARTDMATTYWNNWTGFPAGQQGWFWGVEKQAALGSSWEDYKGLIDELRFWSRAKTTTELGTTWQSPVTGSETGLVGWYDFNEGSGTSTCSPIVPTQCMTLINTVSTNVWNAGEAPTTGGGGDTTAPSVPQSPLAAAASPTTIDLTWNASTDNAGGSGVASYRVQRDGATIAGSVAGTSYGDTGLTANTMYSYTVSAVDIAGNRSAESAAAPATTPPEPADTTPPSVPATFTATATSSTSISLSWAASTDNVAVTGYRVRRAGNATVIASPTGLSFVDTGRTPSTTYDYTVTAVDAAGNESATASASATTPATPDTTAPTAPGNFTATATSSTSISLAWTASTDNVAVTGYRVRRAGNATVIASPTGLSFTDNSRTPSTTYNYTLTAVDAAGNESSPPATASATTPAPPADTIPPTVPGNLQALATSTTAISLTWSASSDNVAVASYRVQRGGITVAADVTGTSYADMGLTPNTSYSYTVSAVDAAANRSAESNAAQATTMATPDATPPTIPANLVATPVSATAVNLTWSASTDNVGVTSYRVRRGGVTIAANVPGTSFSDTGVMPSTDYSYTVSAIDPAGNRSAESTEAQATTPAFVDTTAPTVPANLAAAAVSATAVNLTWSASTDAVGVASYRVQRGGVTVADNVLVTNYSDTGLTSNTAYSYTVSAVDAAGNRSTESTVAQATTPAAPGSSSGGAEPARSKGSFDWATLLAGLALLIYDARRRRHGRSRSLTAGTPPTIA